MGVFELADDRLEPMSETTFGSEGITERGDLQRLLRDQIDILLPDCMVLAEEFGAWEDSRRRIDLLALDKQANLVVIELKRGTDSFMDLQALRYAGMVSTMTFEQAAAAHAAYLRTRGIEADAPAALLDFLEWEEPIEDDFGQDVKIVLTAPDYSKELTTAVLWLNERGLDIRCIRVKPYAWRGRILVDVQQVIPLPETAEYQVKMREKVQRERQGRQSGRDLTKYDVIIGERVHRRLPKRRAMYQVIRHLCTHGVAPEEIHDVLSWLGGSLWRRVDGVVDSAEFVRKATEAAENGGPAFSPGRWFRNDGELIAHNGQTFALTKMWGRRTEEGLRALLDRFPDFGVSYVESDLDE